LYRYNKHLCAFQVDFTSEDLGGTFDAVGIKDQVKNGKAIIKASLSWPTTPANLSFAVLNGEMEINGSKGSFLKVKSGASKFFGMLDLSAIASVLTFDFNRVFGKGFAFNQINGRLRIDNGDLLTDDLIIKGPSAILAFNGRVGLVKEDYDLLMEVDPKLGAKLLLPSLTILGGPAAGLIYGIQALFKKKLAMIYIIKGAWSDPQVEKLKAQEESVEKQPEKPAQPDTTDTESW
jgi:uncharacterized protein YhdP